MGDAAQDVRKIDNPLLVFIVGVTAGYIATIFPLLISYLSTVGGSFDVAFFSGEYILASSFFAVIIGISIMWLNYGKKETTRNIFMTALALPSVLSGAIGMSSTTVNGNAALEEMEDKYITFERALEEVIVASKSPITHLIARDIAEQLENVSLSQLINDENASNNDTPSKSSLSMGLRFTPKTHHEKFMVIVNESKDVKLMKNLLEVYSEVLAISDLKLVSANSKFYIIQDTLRTRSLALVEILKLNNNYNLITKLAEIVDKPSKPKS